MQEKVDMSRCHGLPCRFVASVAHCSRPLQHVSRLCSSKHVTEKHLAQR